MMMANPGWRWRIEALTTAIKDLYDLARRERSKGNLDAATKIEQDAEKLERARKSWKGRP